MSDFQKLLSSIDKGMEGKTPWVYPPYEKLRYHFGIGRSMLTLIGGQSSTGKSAFTHWTYVLGAYGQWKQRPEILQDVKLKIFLYALERPKEYTIAKWVAMKLMLDHGIILDVPTILAFGTAKRPLTKEERNLIAQTQDTFDQMFDECVTLIDIKEGPTGIWKRMRRWAYENGTAYRINDKGIVQEAYLTEEARSTSHGVRLEEIENWRDVPNPKPHQVPKSKYEWHYVPDDPNLITEVVIDHIGILPHERVDGQSAQKGNLDRLSDYVQTLRDRYYFSPILVSQFNRNEQDVMRRKSVQLEPEAQDFEGSSRMYQDADVVLGLFNPYKYRLEDFRGYNVMKMVNAHGYNRLRGLKILKNSYGPDDIVTGMLFVGETGYFEELPPPDFITDEQYYNYANNPLKRN